MKIRRYFADKIYNTLPWLGGLLAGLYGYLKKPIKSYSLYGEDLILMDLFNRDHSGVYVDIGAFHAKWLSNTYLLDKLGWCGVVVDIEKSKMFSFFARSKCYARVGAVVPKGFDKEFVKIYKFQRMSSEYDTIDKETADDYSSRHRIKYDEYQTPAIPIDSLLEEAIKTFNQNIRYINIDVEGADDSILLSINPNEYGVEVLQFENNNEFAGSSSLRMHLQKCGYKHIATLGGTHTYVSDKLIRKRFPLENPAASSRAS